ncbi:Glucose 1-dehydrogenase 4 [Aquicella siphonis]|uniref:Glucose 1-dehydrogenase 4 n=1 Tax=Aquicella siphonis TaxID=254247 RepID=A0A5E4PI42_9COXI|nr:SDR family oxidoreductase [Aquicella siphonis]VVC76594.1 Glucose 1-dehydrogenase 4 [Aquicella siphonis]
MKRLQDKVAVITGGNSGIGKGIAKRFAEEGAKVVIFGRNPETLLQAKNEIGGMILTVQGDVTQTEDLQNLYAQSISHFGKIDIVVANSGVGERIHAANVTEKNFDYMVNINYRGVYFTVRHALEHLNPNASIILIASCAATVTLKRHSVYASTKAAVVKLAQNFAYDLSDLSIRVNSISPGYIRTPIFDERLKQDPEYLARREANIPLKRIGEPQDIANAALFLASSESSYITGVDLLVDGGYSASFLEG